MLSFSLSTFNRNEAYTFLSGFFVFSTWVVLLLWDSKLDVDIEDLATYFTCTLLFLVATLINYICYAVSVRFAIRVFYEFYKKISLAKLKKKLLIHETNQVYFEEEFEAIIKDLKDAYHVLGLCFSGLLLSGFPITKLLVFKYDLNVFGVYSIYIFLVCMVGWFMLDLTKRYVLFLILKRIAGDDFISKKIYLEIKTPIVYKRKGAQP